MLKRIKENKALSVILLIAAGFCAYYLFCAIRWIIYPNSIDYGEGFVLDYAKLLANGGWKWDINVPPYLTMVYGVGYPMLLAPLVKIFGSDLWVGRTFTFICGLVACWLLYLIAKHLTGKKTYGILAALLPMTQFVFRDWSTMVRVDMTAAMFSLLGVYLVIRWKDSKWAYLAVLPFILAMMAKITAVAGLCAVLVYFLIYNRKKLLIFGGWLVAGLAAVIIPLMIVSGGTYFNHVVLYENTINNFNVTNFASLLTTFLCTGFILIIGSFIYLSNKWRDYPIEVLYFVFAFVIGAIGTLRIGSADVYYLETIMAGSICAVLALPAILEYFKKNVKWFWTVVACIAVVLSLVYMPKPHYMNPNDDYTQAVKQAQTIIANTNSPIITETPDVVLGTGKDLYIEPFVFTNMARLGYWNDKNYVKGFYECEYEYVLMRWSIEDRVKIISQGNFDISFTNAVISAIYLNYDLVWQSNLEFPYSLFLYKVR